MKMATYNKAANDSSYNRTPWIVREILGFIAGFCIVSPMMILVYSGWSL